MKNKQVNKMRNNIMDILNEFDDLFQWHQNESWVFVNDKGKSKVRSWLVDTLLKLEKQTNSTLSSGEGE